MKSLLAVLYQFQERGLAKAREEKERELCLQSAGLYLVMLSLLKVQVSQTDVLMCRSSWDCPAAELSKYSTRFCSARRSTPSRLSPS